MYTFKVCCFKTLANSQSWRVVKSMASNPQKEQKEQNQRKADCPVFVLLH
jgi:hypothetical protein